MRVLTKDEQVGAFGSLRDTLGDVVICSMELHNWHVTVNKIRKELGATCPVAFYDLSVRHWEHLYLKWCHAVRAARVALLGHASTQTETKGPINKATIALDCLARLAHPTTYGPKGKRLVTQPMPDVWAERLDDVLEWYLLFCEASTC